MGFIFSIAGNALGLYIAPYFVSNFFFSGGYANYLAAGLLLAVLNYTLKPVLKTISFPFIVITFGLFLIIINAVILWVADKILDFISFETAASLIFTAILIGFINLALGIMRKIID